MALKHCVGFILAGTGLAGMRQRDLIQWYVAQQNEKNNYSSMEEAATEVSKLQAIIQVTQQKSCILPTIIGSNQLKKWYLLILHNKGFVMQSLVRREGHSMVVYDGRQAVEGEAAAQPTSVSRNDRIVAVMPSFMCSWHDLCDC